MSSYITKQIKPIRERVEAKLDREMICELERYCEYLESDRDYVIAQSLAVAFRKDKGFAEWKRSHPVLTPLSEATDDEARPRNRAEK
jgi:hypothetical protein